MTLHRIDSLPEFERHWLRTRDLRGARESEAEALCAPHRAARTAFPVPALSYTAARTVDLRVDWPASGADQPHWRESLACPETGLNSRLRASVQTLDARAGLHVDSDVYITEQVTPLFAHLRGRFTRLTGSEYLGPWLAGGTADAAGTRHEDLTRLSMADASFDAVLSFECLEHIPDFRAAIREIRRVLRPGGRFFFSVPFCAGLHPNTIRARVSPDGTVEHLLPPEYHGDPVAAGGCLCFTHFGWQLMEDLRDAGFVDAHGLAVWSRTFGYIGEELLFFMARRP